MLNLQIWKIKEKDYNLFQKKQKPIDHKGKMMMEDFWRPIIQDEYSVVNSLP